jgi:glutamate N-acetyltransferase/amino-acid N-acetyltransferase
MAKGAGMLAPGLATMLCVVTTDAVIDAFTADQALRSAVRQSFDRVDSDGCMSTNDTVVLLSSGTSGVTPAPIEFAHALRDVCADLAAQLVADAEGATKQVRIEIVGAVDEDDAVTVGRSIARNNLLKCALFGNDPNWGRVLAAIGTTDAQFDPDLLDVAMNGVQVCTGGEADEDRGKVDLTGRDITIRVNLNAGTRAATIWTNDLSHGYVEENSAYSS